MKVQRNPCEATAAHAASLARWLVSGPEGPDFRETCPDPRAEPHFFFARRFQIKSSQAAPNVRQNKQHTRNQHSWQSKTCAKSQNSHHVFKTEQKCANEVLSTHDSSVRRRLQPWSKPAGIPGMSRIKGALMIETCWTTTSRLTKVRLRWTPLVTGWRRAWRGAFRSEQCDVSTSMESQRLLVLLM